MPVVYATLLFAAAAAPAAVKLIRLRGLPREQRKASETAGILVIAVAVSVSVWVLYALNMLY